MAQGGIKKPSRATAPSKSARGTQKGKKPANKVSKTAPKKSKGSSLSADKLQKKYSAGMIQRTEKLLGERAGHLEIIGKGKKAADIEEERKKHRGGTKKFG